MKTETISAASHAEVLRKVADWKTAHPKARIMQEDVPYSHGTDIERGGWTVRIEYEKPGDKALE